uniref:Uncharacterized protein n=1 Tax=Steinernema glaseri TaxID=37863 RepID=A0A1I7ZVK9_9BILA
MRYPSPTNPTGTRKTLAFRCSSTQDEAGESRANKRPPLDSHVSSAVKRVLSSQTSLSTAASNLTQISHSVRASRKSPCGQTLLHFRAFFLPLSLIQTSTNPPTPFRSVLSSLADVSRSILVRTLVAKACAVQNNNLSPPLFNSIGFGSLLCPRATQSILPAR